MGKYEGSDAEVIKAAMPYFEKVISIAQSGNAGEYAGLTEQQFNLAKVFYSVSFFQNNRDSLKENAAGEKKELSEIEKFAGIDVDIFKQSAYLSFWNTNKEVLKVLNSDANMTEIVKLETLKKLSYVLFENYRYFGAEVTVDEMKDLLKQFESALNSVPDSDDSYTTAKNEIKDEVNKKLIPSVEAFYKAELEEIK